MLFPVWFPHRTSTQLWCMRSGEQDRVPRDWDDDSSVCVFFYLNLQVVLKLSVHMQKCRSEKAISEDMNMDQVGFSRERKWSIEGREPHAPFLLHPFSLL